MTRKLERGWDSCMLGRVSEAVMYMEEEFAVSDNHFIPEHARIRGLEVRFDLKAATASARCWQQTTSGVDFQREVELTTILSHR